MSYYHYTKGCHLPSIVREGLIRTTDEGIEKNEKPAVWLTKSPEWESECNVGLIVIPKVMTEGQIHLDNEKKMVTASNEFMRMGMGMCRVVISEQLPTITWAKFKHVSGISEKMYRVIDRTVRRNGSPIDKWICTFKAIPDKYWEGVEMLFRNKWLRWNDAIPIEKFVEAGLRCNKL